LRTRFVADMTVAHFTPVFGPALDGGDAVRYLRRVCVVKASAPRPNGTCKEVKHTLPNGTTLLKKNVPEELVYGANEQNAAAREQLALQHFDDAADNLLQLFNDADAALNNAVVDICSGQPADGAFSVADFPAQPRQPNDQPHHQAPPPAPPQREPQPADEQDAFKGLSEDEVKVRTVLDAQTAAKRDRSKQ
jgi:hypothetical protein